MLRQVLKLGFFLETEAFKRGRAAFAEGAALEANPYLAQAARIDWDLGWRDARRVRAATGNRTAGGDPYAAGKAAATAGIDALANPYHAGHPGFDRWRLGWAQAKTA